MNTPIDNVNTDYDHFVCTRLGSLYVDFRLMSLILVSTLGPSNSKGSR